MQGSSVGFMSGNAACRWSNNTAISVVIAA